MHREIRRIESGTMFTVRPGEEPVSERYFEPKFTPVPLVGADKRDALHERVADVLRDSVAKHMRGGRHRRCVPVPAASTPPRSPRWPRSTTRT